MWHRSGWAVSPGGTQAMQGTMKVQQHVRVVVQLACVSDGP